MLLDPQGKLIPQALLFQRECLGALAYILSRLEKSICLSKVAVAKRRNAMS